MAELHDVVTGHGWYAPAEDHPDRDWWECMIEDLHEAEVELASLPLEHRRAATYLLRDDLDVEDQAADIRRAINEARGQRSGEDR